MCETQACVCVAHRVHQGELLRHHNGVEAQEIWSIFIESILLQQSERTASLIQHCTEKDTDTVLLMLYYQ